MKHGTNYQHPPPEMVDDQEEYKVEQVINHWYYGCKKALQYLICWKGYSAADDTWEPADQVFTDALVKAYHRKHPLKGKKAPTFATCLHMTLAKSHWCPHSPLTNFGVTGPATKQDCIGAPKTFAPMVPTASGTAKNTSTPTHHAVIQPTKLTTAANILEKNALKKSIHRALVKFFSCLPPHTPLCSLTAPTEGWIIVVQCNAPLNALRLPAIMTATLTCGQSASMAGNALSSQKEPPLLPQPMQPHWGHLPPWEWRLVTLLSHGGHWAPHPADGAGPHHHHQSWCNFQPNRRVMSWHGWHACQRTVEACVRTQGWGQADFLRAD